MIVMVLEKVPTGLRGELSRWMLEPKTGVFVGKISAMVRNLLWEKAQKDSKGGAGMLICPAPTEMGFTILTFGDTSRHIVDWEGLQLVRIPKDSAKHVIRTRKPQLVPSDDYIKSAPRDPPGQAEMVIQPPESYAPTLVVEAKLSREDQMEAAIMKLGKGNSPRRRWNTKNTLDIDPSPTSNNTLQSDIVPPKIGPNGEMVWDPNLFDDE